MLTPFILGVIVVVVTSIALERALRARQERRLQQTRGQQARDEFVRICSGGADKDGRAAAVWDYLETNWTHTRKVPIFPSDNLDTMFRLDREDFAEDLHAIAAACGRAIPAPIDAASFKRLCDGTVSDLIEFLGRLPTRRSSE